MFSLIQVPPKLLFIRAGTYVALETKHTDLDHLNRWFVRTFLKDLAVLERTELSSAREPTSPKAPRRYRSSEQFNDSMKEAQR